MFIVVTVTDGNVDVEGFLDEDEARSAADDAASNFDSEYNHGSVEVFEIDSKTGQAKSVYSPVLGADEEEEDEEEEDELADE